MEGFMSEGVTLEMGNRYSPLPPPHGNFRPSPPPLSVDESLLKSLRGIPNKMVFKIGEVAEMLEVKSSVLRYWETEFEMLKPQKSKYNQRMYSRKNVELLFIIKKLLYKDRFSIEGARSVLKKTQQETKKAMGLRLQSQNYSQSQHGYLEQHLEEIKSKTRRLLGEIRRVKLKF